MTMGGPTASTNQWEHFYQATLAVAPSSLVQLIAHPLLPEEKAILRDLGAY